MTEGVVPGSAAAWPARRGAARAAGWPAPDARRRLQLGLAAIWLLDAVLQYQPSMFTTGFSQMIGATAQGNPAVVARPISWDAWLVGHHLTVINAAFATVQLLIALGIAWRPTVKAALAASIAWSLGGWWFGEGLGGVLASPVLAVVLAGIALGVFLPPAAARAAVVLAVVVAALIWIVGEDFGAIFTGSGTDPNSGLLLALLAVANWPARVTRRADATGPSVGPAGRPEPEGAA